VAGEFNFYKVLQGLCKRVLGDVPEIPRDKKILRGVFLMFSVFVSIFVR
jgi:hypothetical protein